MGILLPLFSYCQSPDSTYTNKKLTTTAPLLGGVTVTNIVSPVNAGGNTFTMQQPIVDASTPVYKDFSTAHPVLVKVGIRYQGLFLSGVQNIGEDQFHSITGSLLFNYSVSHTTSISFIGLATMASDFKQSPVAGDILYTVGVRFGFRPTASFKYGITMLYTRNYSGNFLLPLPDIDWSISKRLSLTGIIPARASLKYQLSDMQSLGVTASFNGSMFRLNEDTRNQYIHLRQNNAGFIYDVKLSQQWKFNLVAGHTFLQRLETFNMDQKVAFDGFNKLSNRISNISYLQNSFIFQGGISYEF